MVFTYLAADEFISWRRRNTESTLTMKSSSISDAVRIAVPMTLNNLAGGAAGGASGIEARTAGIMALVASFCMMKMGHTAGVYLMTSIEMNIDTRIISGSIFASLGIMQFIQLLS